MKLSQSIGHEESEPVEITIGFVLPDFESHAEDTTKEPFKFAILDGQHRVTSLIQMQETSNTIPGCRPFKVRMWYKIYVCASNDQLSARIDVLNFRRPFSSADTAKVNVRINFEHAMKELVGTEFRDRRFMNDLLRSEILREETFTTPLLRYDKNWFVLQIKNLSKHAKNEQWKRTANSISPQTVLGKAIRQTELYQLADKSHKWILLLLERLD